MFRLLCLVLQVIWCCPEIIPGLLAIAQERIRQVRTLGWHEENDDQYTDGELAAAGVCYAIGDFNNPCAGIVDRDRDLAKAGALIAAEIDRLERAK
jgi:hypothetical protein